MSVSWSDKQVVFRGTATQEQKDTVLFWLQNYTGNFGKHIIDKLVPTNFDVVLADGKEKKSSATIVFELTVDDDMCNAFHVLHGGCAAFLIDNSVILSAFIKNTLSIYLNIEYHGVVPLGTVVEIVASTKTVRKRVLFLKAEMIHKDKRVLLVSGSHIKMLTHVNMTAGNTPKL
ncbi:hypothetical protein CPB86DRAFT_816842 [Serendipita vermifera]|nr:hypothetical protein CPB86DRAFT_816842 [Serendipita vermifera]